MTIFELKDRCCKLLFSTQRENNTYMTNIIHNINNYLQHDDDDDVMLLIVQQNNPQNQLIELIKSLHMWVLNIISLVFTAKTKRITDFHMRSLYMHRMARCQFTEINTDSVHNKIKLSIYIQYICICIQSMHKHAYTSS